MKTILPLSKRGSITLPPRIRRKYGLESDDGALIIVEEFGGKLILTPATAVPIRDISPKKLKEWLNDDEKEMQSFLGLPTKSAQRR